VRNLADSRLAISLKGRWLGLLAAFGLFLLCRPYQGVRHDGRLYVADALAKLDPGGVGKDLMFVHDGQFGFSLYTPVLARLIGWLGLSGAAMAIVALTLILWFTALVFLIDRLLADRSPALRWAALVFAVVLPSLYGPWMSSASASPTPRRGVWPRPRVWREWRPTWVAAGSWAWPLRAGHAVPPDHGPVLGGGDRPGHVPRGSSLAMGRTGRHRRRHDRRPAAPAPCRPHRHPHGPSLASGGRGPQPDPVPRHWSIEAWSRLAVHACTLAAGAFLLKDAPRRLALGALIAGLPASQLPNCSATACRCCCSCKSRPGGHCSRWPCWPWPAWPC
jgi:hypothetical protein